ncbi:hypothetical protein [Wolbachia endosymbiont (group A) of Anoplius nigerrimus]
MLCNADDKAIVSKSRLKTGSVEKEEINNFLGSVDKKYEKREKDGSLA